MSRFTKTILLIALVLGAMLLLTYTSPGIKAFATGLAKGSRLPIWLVGLAAPLLYVFKKIGGVFGSLFGEGATERGIRESNDAIKAKLDQVERDVQGLDQWRRTQLEPRLARVALLEQQLAGMDARALALSGAIPGLQDRQRQAAAEQERLERELGGLPGIADLPGLPAEEP